jgi:hypothetical protein
MSWEIEKQCQEVRTLMLKKLIREVRVVSAPAKIIMASAPAPPKSDQQAPTHKV